MQRFNFQGGQTIEMIIRRVIPVLFFVLSAGLVSGQINLFIKGGVQNTGIRVINTRAEPDTYKSKWGWYAGGEAGYATKEKVLIISGAGFSLNRYEHKELAMADAIATNNYKLLFLEIPFRLGYQFSFWKKINLDVTGGAYCNIGISGKNNQFIQGFFPGYTEAHLSKKMSFGNDENYEDEFRKVNWGLQTTLSIGLNNKVYMEVYYKHGITNILPAVLDEYEDQKFRVLSLGLKYNLRNTAKEKRSTKASFKKAF